MSLLNVFGLAFALPVFWQGCANVAVVAKLYSSKRAAALLMGAN